MQGFLSENEVLVIVGGDGTFRDTIPFLASTNIPVVLFPAGNESLVAKQFSVSTSIPDLYERIMRYRIEKHFFCLCNDIPFFLMASVGFDSEVVKRVDQIRTKESSNLLYFRAFLKAIFSYRQPRITIQSHQKDGDSNQQFFPTSISGSCIVANSSMYARNFLPAAEASSGHDEFFVRFFLDDKNKEIFNWFRSAVFGTPLSLASTRHHYLGALKFITDTAMPLQLDGDYAGDFSELTFKKSNQQIAFLV